MSSTRLGFSTTPNLSSWLLRKLTGSRVSHTFFMYFDRDWDMEMVLELHETGFRLLPYSRFVKENTVVNIVNPRVDLDYGLRWSAMYLGTAYNFSKLFGMAWVLLGRVLKKNWHNPAQSSSSMFCSEMAVRVLQQAGYPGTYELVAENTSPQDLLDFLEAHPDL